MLGSGTGQLGTHPVPSAARIADILRSHQSWPKAETPVDVAQRVVSQQRQMINGGGGNLFFKSPDLAAGVPLGLESKVGHLAERTSLLLASLQQKAEEERKEMEKIVGEIGSHLEGRIVLLEGRLSVIEQHGTGATLQGAFERAGERHVEEASRVLQESRTLVGTAIDEVQAQWQEHAGELHDGLQEMAHRINEVVAEMQRMGPRVRDHDRNMKDIAHGMKRIEEQVQQAASSDPPAWFGQLEATIANLENRQDEHRAQVDVSATRLRMDVDGVRLRTESLGNLREEILQAVDHRIDCELDRLQGTKPLGSSPQDMSQVQTPRAAFDVTRRIDDADARIAALRVRVDAHDSRFTSIGDRAEAACQQALEGARQAAQQHSEDIFGEADCQLRILRQRVEALSELCEDLSMREAGRGGRAVPHGAWGQASQAEAAGMPPTPKASCATGPSAANTQARQSSIGARLR